SATASPRRTKDENCGESWKRPTQYGAAGLDSSNYRVSYIVEEPRCRLMSRMPRDFGAVAEGGHPCLPPVSFAGARIFHSSLVTRRCPCRLGAGRRRRRKSYD